jgi:hypothetical protein
MGFALAAAAGFDGALVAAAGLRTGAALEPVLTAASAAFNASAAESVDDDFLTTGLRRPDFGVTAMETPSVVAVHNIHAAKETQAFFVH